MQPENTIHSSAIDQAKTEAHSVAQLHALFEALHHLPPKTKRWLSALLLSLLCTVSPGLEKTFAQEETEAPLPSAAPTALTLTEDLSSVESVDEPDIFKGREIAQNEFLARTPFAVALHSAYYAHPYENLGFGGFFASSNVVTTCWHCVNDKEPGDIVVEAGHTDRTQSPYQFQVGEIIHLGGDAAALILTERFTDDPNTTIQSAELVPHPSDGTAIDPTTLGSAALFGRGRTTPPVTGTAADLSNTLKTIDSKPITTAEECGFLGSLESALCIGTLEPREGTDDDPSGANVGDSGYFATWRDQTSGSEYVIGTNWAVSPVSDMTAVQSLLPGEPARDALDAVIARAESEALPEPAPLNPEFLIFPPRGGIHNPKSDPGATIRQTRSIRKPIPFSIGAIQEQIASELLAVTARDFVEQHSFRVTEILFEVVNSNPSNCLTPDWSSFAASDPTAELSVRPGNYGERVTVSLDAEMGTVIAGTFSVTPDKNACGVTTVDAPAQNADLPIFSIGSDPFFATTVTVTNNETGNEVAQIYETSSLPSTSNAAVTLVMPLIIPPDVQVSTQPSEVAHPASETNPLMAGNIVINREGTTLRVSGSNLSASASETIRFENDWGTLFRMQTQLHEDGTRTLEAEIPLFQQVLVFMPHPTEIPEGETREIIADKLTKPILLSRNGDVVTISTQQNTMSSVSEYLPYINVAIPTSTGGYSYTTEFDPERTVNEDGTITVSFSYSFEYPIDDTPTENPVAGAEIFLPIVR